MESEELSADSYVCAEDVKVMPRKSKGGGEKSDEGKRKRRFSDEQIKSLEFTFEAQAKLEPRKKLQLARELGLQPRQVAIWFQNKRARWKSKQLEREYGALRAEYGALLSSFESLEKEKNSLAKQLQKLAELLKKPTGASSSDGGDSDRVGTQGEEERKPSWVSTEGSDLTLMVCSAEGEHTLVPRHHHEEKKVPDHFCVASDPVVDGPLGTDLGAAARQCCFDAAGSSFSDQSCASSSDWWEFWPLNE